MPRFFYKGRSERGEAIEGYIEATTPDAVANQLFNSGITPIDILEARPRADVLEFLRRRLSEGKPGLPDLIMFSRQMYTLMKSGVPIIRAITGLAETTRNPVLARALADVATNLESGRDLASALGRHPGVFSALFINIIRVGENTGRLDESFLQIARYLELEKDTRDRIRTALRYPTLVVVAIAAAIAVINIVVVPAFAKVYAGFHAQLPWATRLLIAISHFTVTFWPLLLTAAVLAVVGVRVYLRTEHGRYRWDKLKLKLPVVGNIILRATLARYARSFAMAMRSGVPLIQALTVVAKAVDNDYVGDRILTMRTGIERGESLTRTAHASGLFTPLVLQMLAVGEETGAVDDLLDEVAGYYEREVDYDLKNLSDAIEPILIVAIGAMVLVLALGVFLPMWDLARVAFKHG
ncbi:MAG: type II secretion system F family protein [Gammaproteobacteria bacterium]|nr:type II secretion system F family protein [Gammaproteobacteria bacterium]